MADTISFSEWHAALFTRKTARAIKELTAVYGPSPDTIGKRQLAPISESGLAGEAEDGKVLELPRCMSGSGTLSNRSNGFTSLSDQFVDKLVVSFDALSFDLSVTDCSLPFVFLAGDTVVGQS